MIITMTGNDQHVATSTPPCFAANSAVLLQGHPHFKKDLSIPEVILWFPYAPPFFGFAGERKQNQTQSQTK